MTTPHDIAVQHARRHAERLAEALGLTVRVSDPVPAPGRRKRTMLRATIHRGDAPIASAVGYSEGELWEEVWRELRSETRDALPAGARTAAINANFARRELIRHREAVEEARKALEQAESAFAAAAAEDAAALIAVHAAQATLPDDRARAVLVALYEVFS